MFSGRSPCWANARWWEERGGKVLIKGGPRAFQKTTMEDKNSGYATPRELNANQPQIRNNLHTLLNRHPGHGLD